MRTYSIGQYEGEFYIPEFRGLMQGGDTLNADARYATDAKNCETEGGVLQPAAMHQIYSIPGQLDTPIETLAVVYMRWSPGVSYGNKMYVAASDGKLYYKYEPDTVWHLIPMPSGVASYQSNTWSWVTYEVNHEGSDHPEDVLLMTNALDGMYLIHSDNTIIPRIESVSTPYKFGIITRYAERIWGSAIIDEPDLLVYSAPYDPMDWEQNVVIPEDGAGEIRQPSWDGSQFIALHPFGDQLIAFKENRVWRILGTNPGEYVLREQYGNGTEYEKSIAVCGEMILMVNKFGVASYDGMNLGPFQNAMVESVWRIVNKNALHQVCAIWWKHRYLLALPTNNSSVNNIVMVWDGIRNIWLKYEDVYVESFMIDDDKLYYTASTTPGRVDEWRIDGYNNAVDITKSLKWVSPWTDLGAKNITKDSFEVYFTPEFRGGGDIKIRFTLETERRAKYKDVVVKKYPYDPPVDPPVTHETTEVKQQKIFFGGSGRRFRLIIEWLPSIEEYTTWRLIGGVLVRCNLDRD